MDFKLFPPVDETKVRFFNGLGTLILKMWLKNLKFWTMKRSIFRAGKFHFQFDFDQNFFFIETSI